MKIRTDFVTNSSSSSFNLMIRFDLTDGSRIAFDARGGSDEGGRADYFANDAIVRVSPKQLGTAKNVDALIELLAKGVVDYEWVDEEVHVFDKSRPVKSDIRDVFYDAYDFIVEIREKIKSMDQIVKVTISGDEEGRHDEFYERTYTYDRTTEKYTGEEVGCVFEKDGSSGGDLEFDDLNSCEIEYDGDEE